MDKESLTLRILTDPSVSYWLKDAVQELAHRDPEDARNDILVLMTLYDIEAVEECDF